MFREIFLEFQEIQNHFVKISRNTKFWQNNFEFRDIRGKFNEITKTKISQPPYVRRLYPVRLSLYTVFHSVIYNSVVPVMLNCLEFHIPYYFIAWVPSCVELLRFSHFLRVPVLLNCFEYHLTAPVLHILYVYLYFFTAHRGDLIASSTLLLHGLRIFWPQLFNWAVPWLYLLINLHNLLTNEFQSTW